MIQQGSWLGWGFSSVCFFMFLWFSCLFVRRLADPVSRSVGRSANLLVSEWSLCPSTSLSRTVANVRTVTHALCVDLVMETLPHRARRSLEPVLYCNPPASSLAKLAMENLVLSKRAACKPKSCLQDLSPVETHLSRIVLAKGWGRGAGCGPPNPPPPGGGGGGGMF